MLSFIIVLEKKWRGLILSGRSQASVGSVYDDGGGLDLNERSGTFSMGAHFHRVSALASEPPV